MVKSQVLNDKICQINHHNTIYNILQPKYECFKKRMVKEKVNIVERVPLAQNISLLKM